MNFSYLRGGTPVKLKLGNDKTFKEMYSIFRFMSVKLLLKSV